MSVQGTSYRSAVAADAWEMIGVHYAAVQAVGSGRYSQEVIRAWSPLPDESRRDWLASLISEEGTLSAVAVAGQGELVGFCIALPAQEQLKALYVHPASAGKGVGRALLSHIETRCRDVGLGALELNSSYNAQPFYLRNGYRVVGPITQALTPEISMGAIRMAK